MWWWYCVDVVAVSCDGDGVLLCADDVLVVVLVLLFCCDGATVYYTVDVGGTVLQAQPRVDICICSSTAL